MYTEEKLLEMITSKKTNVRYDAVEWIRISQESSPEMVRALEKATHDPDAEIAERAQLALVTDAHHRMAIKMGLIQPDPVDQQDLLKEREPDQHGGSIDPFDNDPFRDFDGLQWAQAIAFIAGVGGLIFLWIKGKNPTDPGILTWLIYAVYLVYIGLQIYAIQKKGFKESFSFLVLVGIIVIRVLFSVRRR